MSKEYNTKEVMSDKPCTVVSKDTIKRLVKDIKDIRKNPMEDDGIFYSHDDTNFLKGYAMIVGTQGSLYFGGYYFFYFGQSYSVDFHYLSDFELVVSVISIEIFFFCVLFWYYCVQR